MVSTIPFLGIINTFNPRITIPQIKPIIATHKWQGGEKERMGKIKEAKINNGMPIIDRKRKAPENSKSDLGF